MTPLDKALAAHPNAVALGLDRATTEKVGHLVLNGKKVLVVGLTTALETANLFPIRQYRNTRETDAAGWLLVGQMDEIWFIGTQANPQIVKCDAQALRRACMDIIGGNSQDMKDEIVFDNKQTRQICRLANSTLIAQTKKS